MKKDVAAISSALLCAFTASAQDFPRYETFLGYTFIRANSATNGPAFSANGGGGQFVYNFNWWLSGVADLGAAHTNSISGFRVDNTSANLLFGPRLSIRKRRITPYFQAVLGGVYATASTRLNGISILESRPVLLPGQNQAGVFAIPGEPVTARMGAQKAAFAMAIGGGIDFRITRHMQFRPVALDYYMTRLQNLRIEGDNNQNNLRYSTGFTFTFGGERAAPALSSISARGDL